MTDFGSILQSAVTLAGFLIGVNAFLPKGLDEEWFAYFVFLVPSPVLFLITAGLATYGYDFTVLFFEVSIVILILLFVGLGIWSTWEKYAEHQLKEIIRTKNPEMYRSISSALSA